FLEILHVYHKEQHTIKDVYEQVATLFAHHEDLLQEFTAFLPDPSPNADSAPQAASKKRRKKAGAGDVGGGGGGGKAARRRLADDSSSSAAAGGGHYVMAGEEKLVPNASYEELQFFFKVKRRLKNTPLYQELLKVRLDVWLDVLCLGVDWTLGVIEW